MGKNLWARLIRSSIILTLLGVLLMATYLGIILLYPFLIGLIFAYWIQPMIRFFENRFHLQRITAVFLSILILFLCFITVFIFLLTQLYQHMEQFFMIFPQIFEQFMDTYQNFFESHLLPTYEKILAHFQHFNMHAQNQILETMRNFGTNMMHTFEQFMHALLNQSLQWIRTLPSVFTTILLALLATFFLSKDWEKFQTWFFKQIPIALHQKGKILLLYLQKALFGWFKAQAILILFSGLLVWIGLLILRVPYAFTLTVCIALVDLIPLLGTGVIFLPWIFAMILAGNMPFAISLLILYILVIAQRQMLEPKILSGNLGMDPLATLISVFVGFQIFGFWGLILGPAFFVIATACYQSGIVSDIWSYIQTGKNPYL